MSHQIRRRSSSAPDHIGAPRPLVGWSLLGIAAVHLAAAPVVYPDSLRSTLAAGVVGAVERDPALIPLRGVGFWYITAGIGWGLLGGVVRWCELRVGAPPKKLGWALGITAACGAALMPKSGFWALFVPAALVLRANRSTGRRWR